MSTEVHRVLVYISDRDHYDAYEFATPDGSQRVSLSLEGNLCPRERRWFNRDILDISFHGGWGDSAKKVDATLVHSPTRESAYIPGVLMLEGGRTYGKNASGGRSLYRCVPDDRRLPCFLVPYDPQKKKKKFVNKYVLFRFALWSEKEDVPRGQLVETLGEVDSLEAYYSYQMYRRSLYVDMKELYSRATAALQTSEEMKDGPAVWKRKYPFLEDSGTSAFTMDGPNTVDYDDALSVSREDEESGHTYVSVFVANVVFPLDQYGLWTAMTRRVATVYLPDKRRPMLPSHLTEQRLSLTAGKPRMCLEFRFRISEEETAPSIVDVEMRTSIVTVSKNYIFDEPALLASPSYKELLQITARMDRHIHQSQDVVAFWMIRTNEWVARRFVHFYGRGIIRGAPCTPRHGSFPAAQEWERLDEDSRRVVMGWSYSSGKYMCVDTTTTTMASQPGREDPSEGECAHEMLRVEHYAHATSPIRRLVDLLNQIVLLWDWVSPAAHEFFEDWTREITYINLTMRAIKRVETDCEVLRRCAADPGICEKEYHGVLFDAASGGEISRSGAKENGERPECRESQVSTGVQSCMVYLPLLRLLTRISVPNTFFKDSRSDPNGVRQGQFRVFYFSDRDTLIRKVRVAIVSLEDS